MLATSTKNIHIQARSRINTEQSGISRDGRISKIKTYTSNLGGRHLRKDLYPGKFFKTEAKQKSKNLVSHGCTQMGTDENQTLNPC
jgi:hypothetical protein